MPSCYLSNQTLQKNKNGKDLNSIAYVVIFIIATPITIIELIFKIVSFVILFLIFIVMMFMAPLFRNFCWPNLIQKFINYVFSLHFTMTCKIIDTYKKSLCL